MTDTTKPKIIVVVGPTASGKSALAVDIAKQFDGEVVSGDSRQVYRGLDLGTGKVTEEEMRNIPHHLLDVSDPSDTYTAADFAHDGRKAVDTILQKDRLPIVAGGSFFYIDTLIGNIQTPETPPNKELRNRLDKMSTESLYSALLRQDPRRAEDIDAHNKRRLIRALEIIEAQGAVPQQTPNPFYDTCTIGIATNKKLLRQNIRTRIDVRIQKGMIEEVAHLHDKGLTYERMDELGLEYRYIGRYLQDIMTKEEMVTTLEQKTWQFAKRQLTWLKRDKNIHWYPLSAKEAIFETVATFLRS